MGFNSLTITIVLCLVSSTFAFSWTALDIDNHPCKPENLKKTNRYICDNAGKIICQAGWREPEVYEPLHDLNPCLEPICDVDRVGGCVHGECRAPNFCACEVGWEGAKCDQCVPLPGCDHGTCTNAFECNCEDGWEGAYCDIASCDNCSNGVCVAPGECSCLEGWMGENCDVCQARPGCVHGDCGAHPNTCVCTEGWEGFLCDKPICSPPCDEEHGSCQSVTFNNQTTVNYCLCHSGWRGERCEKCRPYWNCPNQDDSSCNQPNECFCHGHEADHNLLCNNTLLNSHQTRALDQI